MKKILILIILFIVTSSLSQTRTKAVSIINTTKVLNSKTNISLAGDGSKIVLPINLPKNTVDLFYAFSTQGNSGNSSKLNLLIQVAATIKAGALGKALVSQLKIPPGSGKINIYLMDSNYKTAFLSDSNREVLYYEGLSEKNATEGKKNIKQLLNGNYSLGIENPSIFNSLKVNIEVVAIVKEESMKNGWTSSVKQNLYNKFKRHFTKKFSNQLNKFELNNLTSCIMLDITSSYTPDEINAYADYELNNVFSRFLDKCIDKLNFKNLNLVNPSENINEKYLIGKWGFEKTPIKGIRYLTMYETGLLNVTYKNGNIGFGYWILNGNIIKFVINSGNTTNEYIIFELTNKIFKHKHIKSNTIIIANKIGKF